MKTVFSGTRLSEAIASHLFHEGLTLEVAARQAGVHPTTLCKIRQGARPDVQTLGLLAHWLGLTVDFFYEAEEPGGPPIQRGSQIHLASARGTGGDGA